MVPEALPGVRCSHVARPRPAAPLRGRGGRRGAEVAMGDAADAWREAWEFP